MAGFAWTYLVVAIGSNREDILASLKQGTLPAEYHSWIMMALAGLLAVSAAMLVVHLMRFFGGRGRNRRNSGATLIGVMSATTLIYMPDDIWNAGEALLDDRSRAIISTASNTLNDQISGSQLTPTSFVVTGRP